MKRRRFLQLLGIAPLAVKAAPLLKLSEPAKIAYTTYVMGNEAIFTGPLSDELIGACVSYRFKYVVAYPPVGRLHFRRIEATDAIN